MYLYCYLYCLQLLGGNTRPIRGNTSPIRRTACTYFLHTRVRTTCKLLPRMAVCRSASQAYFWRWKFHTRHRLQIGRTFTWSCNRATRWDLWSVCERFVKQFHGVARRMDLPQRYQIIWDPTGMALLTETLRYFLWTNSEGRRVNFPVKELHHARSTMRSKLAHRQWRRMMWRLCHAIVPQNSACFDLDQVTQKSINCSSLFPILFCCLLIDTFMSNFTLWRLSKCALVMFSFPSYAADLHCVSVPRLRSYIFLIILEPSAATFLPKVFSEQGLICQPESFLQFHFCWISRNYFLHCVPSSRCHLLFVFLLLSGKLYPLQVLPSPLSTRWWNAENIGKKSWLHNKRDPDIGCLLRDIVHSTPPHPPIPPMAVPVRFAERVLPYISYTGMCHCEHMVFRAISLSQGYIIHVFVSWMGYLFPELLDKASWIGCAWRCQEITSQPKLITLYCRLSGEIRKLCLWFRF